MCIRCLDQCEGEEDQRLRYKLGIQKLDYK